jgi:FtsZ-binding cell division protein ZapB
MTLSSQIGDPKNTQTLQLEIQELQTQVSNLKQKKNDLQEANDKLVKQIDNE